MSIPLSRAWPKPARYGTTTLVNLEAFPELLPRLPRPADPRVVVRRNNRHPQTGQLSGDFRDVARLISCRIRTGSAMSVWRRTRLTPRQSGCMRKRPRLRGRKARCSRRISAESSEEMQMFRDARGPAFDFLKSIGRPMEDCGQETPLAFMMRHQKITEGLARSPPE